MENRISTLLPEGVRTTLVYAVAFALPFIIAPFVAERFSRIQWIPLLTVVGIACVLLYVLQAD